MPSRTSLLLTQNWTNKCTKKNLSRYTLELRCLVRLTCYSLLMMSAPHTWIAFLTTTTFRVRLRRGCNKCGATAVCELNMAVTSEIYNHFYVCECVCVSSMCWYKNLERDMIHLLVYLPFLSILYKVHSCDFIIFIIMLLCSHTKNFHVQLMESYGVTFCCAKTFSFLCVFFCAVTIKFYGEHLCAPNNTRFDLFYVLKNCGRHEEMSTFEK